MRLPPISPAQLSPEQRSLYDDMKAGVTAKYSEFQTFREDGAILGPWNAWLHEPAVGGAAWELAKALTAFRYLPDDARQIAILVVGVRFGAAYEIHAHKAVAKKHRLDDLFIDAILSGTRPTFASAQQEIAYDVARKLTDGGALPESVYQDAIKILGDKGAKELIYLVGHYCLVSITLNGFDVPV